VYSLVAKNVDLGHTSPRSRPARVPANKSPPELFERIDVV
jgi:hypothetical protein